MPPATAMSYSSQRMAFAAYITAFNPEPQTLLMVTAPAETGMPAPMPACRAGACPTAACNTLPMITCSICSACTPEFCSAHLMAMEPSFGAESDARVPRNEPIGVRAPPRMTISFIESPWIAIDAPLYQQPGNPATPVVESRSQPGSTLTGV